MPKADKEGQRKAPILRFKGFTNAWEQRQLGKQNKITMGQSPSSKNYTDNPKDWILIQGNADLKSGKVAPRIYTSQLTKKADIGDIILTVRAPVGEVAITDYDAVLGRGVAAIKGNLFIYFALEKFKANNKWNMYSSGSTFDSITGKDLNNLPLFFPSETEENKIGVLLNKLDNLLALYDRKLKLLSQIKKYFLDNLFAKKEYPNLRFKGFTDAWEQRKLNEVATRVLRKNKNLISKRPLTISAQYGLIDQQAFFNKQVASSNLENYLLLEKGEFAYNKSYSDGFPYGTIKKLNLYDNGAVSTLYIAFKANADINSDFLENLFSSNKWNNEVYKIAAEGARNHGLLNISPDDFFNIKITISKDSQEQVFISKFLKVFDNLLALYENKQNYLTEIKNTLLNTMFI